MIEPRRRVLLSITRDIMGATASDEKVLFCEISIVSQYRALLTIRCNDLEQLVGQSFSREFIKRLADHIADFYLAGINAVGDS